jgi:hypothetical protein
MLEKLQVLWKQTEKEIEAGANEVLGPHGGGDGQRAASVVPEQDGRRHRRLEELQVAAKR